jgi:hypothetical protein
VRETSWRYDQGMHCANMAKLLAADAANEAVDQAMQSFGGFGNSTGYDVSRTWREPGLMRIAPVPQEMILSYLSEHVLGLPRSYRSRRLSGPVTAGWLRPHEQVLALSRCPAGPRTGRTG